MYKQTGGNNKGNSQHKPPQDSNNSSWTLTHKAQSSLGDRNKLSITPDISGKLLDKVKRFQRLQLGNTTAVTCND